MRRLAVDRKAVECRRLLESQLANFVSRWEACGRMRPEYLAGRRDPRFLHNYYSAIWYLDVAGSHVAQTLAELPAEHRPPLPESYRHWERMMACTCSAELQARHGRCLTGRCLSML